MDSNYVDQSSMSLLLDQSSFGVIRCSDVSCNDKDKLPARIFSSNINAPVGDATENMAGNANNLFEDDEDYFGNMDARLSDPTPRKMPNFDVNKIRYQLVENESRKHVLPETVVDNTQSESMVQVLEADFKPIVNFEENDESLQETPKVEFYKIEE